MSEQTRLILLPGELTVWRRGGTEDTLRVFIVDYRHMGYGAFCTIILREPVPADVTWTGSRLPGGIAQVDAEDVAVDLAAAEAAQLP